MYAPIRIILADDHEIFRNGFKLLLRNQKELELVAEATNGKHLVELVDQHHPDIVITDIKMPEMDGIQASKKLKTKYPGIGIIALSMFNDDYLVVDMLEAGARGYLLKNTTREELVEAVRCVYDGGTYYCSDTSKKLTNLLSKSSFNPYHNHEIELTEREKEIIVLICRQLSNKEIAKELDLNVRTIESHREKIQEKIGSRNMVGIVLFAIKTGIFKLEET